MQLCIQCATWISLSNGTEVLQLYEQNRLQFQCFPTGNLVSLGQGQKKKRTVLNCNNHLPWPVQSQETSSPPESFKEKFLLICICGAQQASAVANFSQFTSQPVSFLSGAFSPSHMQRSTQLVCLHPKLAFFWVWFIKSRQFIKYVCLSFSGVTSWQKLITTSQLSVYLTVSAPSGLDLSIGPLTCPLTVFWGVNEKHRAKILLNWFSSLHLLGLQRRLRRNNIPLHTCPLGQDLVAALAWKWVCWKQRSLCWEFCRSFSLRPAQRLRFVHAEA